MLPGVAPKDVRIQVTYGSFQRQIEPPGGVDKDKLTAEYHNGVLEIAAPISAAALPRKIEVKSVPTAKGASA
jgi:hypothetical protein